MQMHKQLRKSKYLSLLKTLIYIIGFLIATSILDWFTVNLLDNFDENSEPIANGIANYPKHTKYFFVNDYSSVLTETTEQYIYDQAKKLENATTSQVVVVMAPDTGLNTFNNYSLQLANKWKIGTEKDDNGVLIFFTTKQPHVRIEVGKGLGGVITDAAAGRILDEYAVDYIHTRKWNSAAINVFVEVVKRIYNSYSIEPPTELHIFETVSELSESDGGRVTMADAKIEPVDYSKANSFANPEFSFRFLEYYLLDGLILFIIIIMASGNSRRTFNGSSNRNLFRSSKSSSSFSSSSSSSSNGGGGSFGGGGASR